MIKLIKFMLSNIAYKLTVYKTGVEVILFCLGYPLYYFAEFGCKKKTMGDFCLPQSDLGCGVLVE